MFVKEDVINVIDLVLRVGATKSCGRTQYHG